METKSYHRARRESRFAQLFNVKPINRSRWGIVFTTFIAHLILPNLILSHGTILLMKVDDDASISEFILAPCILGITIIFTEPFFREAAENWANKIGVKKLLICGVIITFIAVLSCAFVSSPILYSLCYGFIGGIGTSLTLSQITYVISDVFYSNIGLAQAIFSLGESIGQVIMPFVILLIFNLYGNQMGFLIFSGIVLQLLPAVLHINSDPPSKTVSLPDLQNKSQMYTMFTEESPSKFPVPENIQLKELTQKTWKSPSDENLPIPFEDEDQNEQENEMEYEIQIEYVNEQPKSPLGFEILPQIIEESEYSDSSSDSEDQKTFKELSGREQVDDSIKRYSVISDKFDEFILKIDTEDLSIKKIDNTQVNSTIKSSTINKSNANINEIENSAPMQENSNIEKPNGKCTNRSIKMSCCPLSKYSPSSYNCYRSKRRAINNCEALKETFLMPFLISIKTWQFYPALLIKVCTLFIPFGTSSLLPLMGRTLYPDESFYEAVLILSTHGFGWLSFLIASPWVINISKSKYKHFVIVGFFTSAITLFVIMETTYLAVLIAATFFMGVSNGAISLTYKEVLKESIGARNWSIIRDTLDRVSAIALIFLTIWMKKIIKTNGIKICFGFFASLHGITGIIVGIIPFMKIMRKRKDLVTY